MGGSEQGRVGAEVLGAGRVVVVVGATCTTWGGRAELKGGIVADGGTNPRALQLVEIE